MPGMRAGFISAVTALWCAGIVTAQTPTDPKSEIVLGMSTALTGPADELGLNVQAGVLAALDEANRAGGVIGRTLRLVTLDDGYEPSRTAPNMHKLIEEEKVLAVIGNVGTPTAVAAIPIVNARQVVLFGAYTGAGALRKTPPDRYVINYRASYADETSAMVDALVNEAGISVDEIAFFTQRDAYGDAGYVGGVAAMQRHGLKSEVNIAHGRYERNTDAVENGLADIVSAHVSPRAVIMVGAYAPCAAFIKLAREYGFDPIFLNVSFVGSQPLANVLGDAGEGVIVTQVVPHFDSDLPIAREYRSALAARGGDMQPTFGSFEGYIAGRILLRALSDVTEIPTRESIVDALDGLGKFDIGLGLELELSPDQHSACHEVWPTVIRGGEVVPMSWTDLRR